MDIADLQTVLFFYIHEIGTTPAINQYIATVQRGESTAAIWHALTSGEQAIIQAAYNRLRLESAA